MCFCANTSDGNGKKILIFMCISEAEHKNLQITCRKGETFFSSFGTLHQAILAPIPDHITCTKKCRMQENIEVVVEENSSFSREGITTKVILRPWFGLIFIIILPIMYIYRNI